MEEFTKLYGSLKEEFENGEELFKLTYSQLLKDYNNNPRLVNKAGIDIVRLEMDTQSKKYSKIEKPTPKKPTLPNVKPLPASKPPVIKNGSLEEKVNEVDYKTEYDELKEFFDYVKEERDSLDLKNEQLQNTVESIESEYERLESEVLELRGKIAESVDYNKDSNKIIIEVGENPTRLEEELIKARDQKEPLRKKLENINDEVRGDIIEESILENCEDYEKELFELKHKRLTDYFGKMVLGKVFDNLYKMDLTGQRDVNNKAIKNKFKEIRLMETDDVFAYLKNSTKELEESNNPEVKEFSKKIEEYEENPIEEVSFEGKEDLEAKIQDLEELLKNKNKEIQEVVAKNTNNMNNALEAQKEMYEQKLKAQQEKYESQPSNQEADEYKTMMDTLTTELNNSNKKIQELEDKIKEYESGEIRTEEGNQELIEKIQALKREKIFYESQIKELEEKLEKGENCPKLKEEVVKLKGELEKVKKEEENKDELTTLSRVEKTSRNVKIYRPERVKINGTFKVAVTEVYYEGQPIPLNKKFDKKFKEYLIYKDDKDLEKIIDVVIDDKDYENDEVVIYTKKSNKNADPIIISTDEIKQAIKETIKKENYKIKYLIGNGQVDTGDMSRLFTSLLFETQELKNEIYPLFKQLITESKNNHKIKTIDVFKYMLGITYQQQKSGKTASTEIDKYLENLSLHENFYQFISKDKPEYYKQPSSYSEQGKYWVSRGTPNQTSREENGMNLLRALYILYTIDNKTLEDFADHNLGIDDEFTWKLE